ncbi:unnamed protein product, partial [Pelagomonas calceolata]
LSGKFSPRSSPHRVRDGLHRRRHLLMPVEQLEGRRRPAARHELRQLHVARDAVDGHEAAGAAAQVPQVLLEQRHRHRRAERLELPERLDQQNGAVGRVGARLREAPHGLDVGPKALVAADPPRRRRGRGGRPRVLLELDALEHDDAVAARQRRCRGLAARREDRGDDDDERHQHTDCGGVDEGAAVHCLRCAFASGAASVVVVGLLWQAGCLQMCLAYGVTLYRCTAIANGFETHVSRLKRGLGASDGTIARHQES